MNTQVDLLEVAGNMLETQDSQDLFTPAIPEVASVNQHAMLTASGLNDYDYQPLSNLSMGHKELNQLHTVNKIPIPPEILEHLKHIKCHCMMGLFPEIGRAWLTIDSEIYIWTYEQTRDVAYYDGLSHLIVSVGLVKPKSGVFISDVKHLLILTTPIEIIVLGITFADTTKIISSPMRSVHHMTIFEEMQLMSKPIFIVATDNVTLNVVLGSENGRIFLGGRDGNLYEISYQAESSWFGKRCKKLNHSQGIVSYIVPSFLKVFSETDPIVRMSEDSSRNLLYVLSEKGSIEVWDMGQDSNNMRRLTKVTQNEVANSASNIIKTVDPSIFKNIKSICPLTFEDSANLNLLAVTQCGVRLYFTTSALHAANLPYNNSNQICRQTISQNSALKPNVDIGCSQNSLTSNIIPEKKQRGLYLMHVRLPPGYTPNTTINKPKNVHMAHFNEGTLLMVSAAQQDQNLLWSISSSPFPNRTNLTESTAIMNLDGIVWSLAEMPRTCNSNLRSILRRAQIPKRVILLTNQGAHIIELLKPTDILQQLLISYQGPHHDAVKAFFKSQDNREACATALLLACSEQYRGTDLALWASQAFLLYGGEPAMSNQLQKMEKKGINTQTSRSNIDNTSLQDLRQVPPMFMSTPMANSCNGPSLQQAFENTTFQRPYQRNQYVFSPSFNETPNCGSGISQVNDINFIVYSYKHDSLYMHVARLLRPIWKMRCTDDTLNSKLTKADCTIILEDLYQLRNFLESNGVNDFSSALTFFNSQTALLNGFSNIQSTYHAASNSTQMNTVEQAHAKEKRSLAALTYFIKHTCEVLALWKILCEHQFHIIASLISNEQQGALTSCTFRELILSGSDLCAVLIVALINCYLKDNASVSIISAKLRDVCPNIYRHEDAVSFKATEILMNSKLCNVLDEKQEKMQSALQLCKDAAPNLPLQNICQQFTLSGFYEGVIELTTTCAAKTDPEEFGINFYMNNEPEEDQEGYTLYAARLNCYKEVKAMLDYVLQTVCNANTGKDFLQNACENEVISSSNAQIMKIVQLSVKVKDPLLHVTVYEWLMVHNMLTELLSLTEKTLGEFLRRNVVCHPDNLNLIDLLWKYYEKNGYHAKAAHILDNLASTKFDGISLELRIDYLARAVMCMRNDGVGYSITNGVLLKELEDKLEIARVQKSVLDALSSLEHANTEVAKSVNDLNSTLFGITELYEDFADRYNLWECKLTILNCSHHNDPLLIESIWSQIIKIAVESTGSKQERSTRLFSKFESLYREFGESGHCFPLAFIIRELEIKACQMHFSEGIVPEKLLALNIDVELLMEYYSRMISLNERVWANEGNEWHLVQSTTLLILLLCNNRLTQCSRSKRRVLGKAQDMVSVCLNLCYQKPGTEHMQQKLKELQCRLQRSHIAGI